MSKARLATLTRRRPFPGQDSGPLVISTEKWTGDANHAWKAIKDAKLHIWDTAPGKIEVVTGHDLAGVKRRVIAALTEAGFFIDDRV